jgi:hypothetical protein
VFASIVGHDGARVNGKECSASSAALRTLGRVVIVIVTLGQLTFQAGVNVPPFIGLPYLRSKDSAQ